MPFVIGQAYHFLAGRHWTCCRPAVAVAMTETGIYCQETDKELLIECHESMWADPDSMPYRLTLRRLAEERLESERTAVLGD